MGYLTALLPVAQAVAVYAALNRYANTARAVGDDRSRGQLMADELVTRITKPPAASAISTNDGQPASAPSDAVPADALGTTETGSTTETNSTTEHSRAGGADSPDPSTVPPGASLDIQLIMTDRTLFVGDDEPATIIGYGPIPAPLARALVRNAGPQIRTWIRRLFTNPDTGHLVTADSQRRTFSHAVRRFLIARDQVCRTPWCEAPIRHADHITPYARGGPTTINNGQGTCENCNYTKEAPGWSARAEPDGIGITITTPTGHTIRSDPPPPPRSAPWVQQHSPLEARIRRYLAAA